ncbi:FAD-dependent monooxygenase [Mycobacteroides abscessus]|uniref:FAD-dependent monooxygenase n=1 Tax=Mycobacteroides abscessus TaxID=36809 RepID=UPI0013FD0A82|nr:FAD-dependent monooxygenase [Mycobacteroides abscessus]
MGAGIAGLAAAIALRKSGWQVHVFEQAAAFSGVGAGLVLLPNGFAALDAIGLGDAVRAVGSSFAFGAVRDHRGRELSRASRSGPDFMCLRRPDLLRILHEALPEDSLHMNCRIESVDTAGVVLVAGQVRQFDIVVLADGVRSSLRGQWWPEIEPRRTGVIAWRWIADCPLSDFAGIYLGPDFELGMLPLPGRRTLGFAALPDDGVDLERCLGMHPDIDRVIGRYGFDDCHRDELVEIRPPRNLHRGAVALLGDAAHGMRPHLGQGAGLALEDAVTLAHYAPDLAGYSRARRRRVRVASSIANHLGSVTVPPHRWLSTPRNALLQIIPSRVSATALLAVASWQAPVTAVALP